MSKWKDDEMGVAFGTCGEKRNAYWNLVRNLNDGNTLKTRRVWADNIKMDLNDIEGKNVDLGLCGSG